MSSAFICQNRSFLRTCHYGEEKSFFCIFYSPIQLLDLWSYNFHKLGPQKYWHPEIKDAACEIFASWHISEIKEAACKIFASWHISEIVDAASENFASWHISGALMEKRTFSPGSLISQFTRWTFAHTFPTHRALQIIGILVSNDVKYNRHVS
ncbi:hypothetical protein STEG23_009092 [Scotinomys teguina]